VYAAIGAVILILILLLGTSAYFLVTRPPTLDVSRTTVSPGDSIVVTASHVPHNQAGNIELHSVLTTYPFKADGNGNVRGTIFLPTDIEFGTHTLRICWSGACRAQVILHVVDSGSGQGSPGTSPQPGVSPSPGSTPQSTPTSRPVGGSSPTPTHAPSPTPTRAPSPPPPSPTPTSNPCPTSASPASLKASPTTAVGGTNVALAGSNFTPNKQVTLTYYRGGTSSGTWSTSVACNGTYASSVKTAAALIPRTDHVTACDSSGRCASAYISIIL
jgi:hypothetical protein